MAVVKVVECMGSPCESTLCTLDQSQETKSVQLLSCGIRSSIASVNLQLLMWSVFKSQSELYRHCMLFNQLVTFISDVQW
jgi:hypothetical protein